MKGGGGCSIGDEPRGGHSKGHLVLNDRIFFLFQIFWLLASKLKVKVPIPFKLETDGD
jgi:hypothetical protein